MSDAPKRFNILYRNGAYYVTIPEYHGGEVVDASVADALAAALKGMVDMYADLVNSGDAGFWDPEKVDEMKHARTALALMPTVVGSLPTQEQK